MATKGRVRVERAPKRVRVYLGGELLADTTRARYVWENPYYPAYFFPREDVRMELLTPSDATKSSPSRGTASYFTVKTSGGELEEAARTYTESPVEELTGLIAFDWAAMDAWFEEDEEVFVHPRDPYTRIDVLPSSRHVEVIVNGVKVADTHSPRLLFETGLPTRYYLPKVDVRMDLLTPTETATDCPYKGTAEYWSVEAGGEVFEDIVWGYKAPVEESARIAGLVCFYNEKVDISVDGELEPKPKSPFS